MAVTLSFGSGGGLSEVIPFTNVPASTSTLEIPLTGVTRQKAVILLSIRSLRSVERQQYAATLNGVGAGGYFGAMAHVTAGGAIASYETLLTNTEADFLYAPGALAVADTFGVYEIEIYKPLLTNNRRLVKVSGGFITAATKGYYHTGVFAMGNNADWDNIKLIADGGYDFHTDSGYQVLQL